MGTGNHEGIKSMSETVTEQNTAKESEPKEIERKFLVHSIPEDLISYEAIEINQGYLAIEPNGTEIRLRQKDDSYFLTAKSGASEEGLVRAEREIPLTRELFDVLWPATEGRRIEKTRYKIPAGQHTIELDVFKGSLSGLILAEIEFPSVAESTAFKPPLWFGADVTADKAFKNQNLATQGVPQSVRRNTVKPL